MMKMVDKRHSVILIPTLNPKEQLYEYVTQLYNSGFVNIIIVDDGSSKECQNIFARIENEYENVDILHHAINYGKGRGLKNGLNYYLASHKYDDANGIITVDSDGQHLLEDVIRIDDMMTKEFDGMILGYRDFNGSHVPLKSSFGNKCTRVVFRLLFGKDIIDTQTGLRAFSRNAVKEFLDLNGERFEYETNVLIKAVQKKMVIYQIPIHTVYENNNEGTHFHPIKDSLKIYVLIFSQFLKYVASSLLSFVIDVSLFELIFKILSLESAKKIWLATIVARVVSSMVNYAINRKVVFGAKESQMMKSMVKYYILCVVTVCLSGMGVGLFHSLLGMHEAIAKCIVDSILFLFNYKIQQIFVFVDKK